MEKKFLMMAAAAAMFAACSNESDPVQQAQEVAKAAEQVAQQVPIQFDTYVNRATTRAGLSDALVEIGDLQATNVGFGVFGYYTNADNYDQTFTPNFMYNQHVTYNASKWEYSPVKYWPNEFGANSASDDVDKVSFFAYAPFVTVNPSSGKVVTPAPATYPDDNPDVTKGIVGMKSNTATGDPMIKYISTFYTDKQVDLLFGTYKTGITWTKKNSGTQDFTDGKPWLDVEHPSATNATLDFDFKHALAKLNVTVDTKVEGTDPADPATGTKVYIRSVTFEGFDVKGALNLNNNDAANGGTAVWFNFDGTNELSDGGEVTIKDGRMDGKEGLSESTKEYAAINPTLIQPAGAVSADNTNGVNATVANLFSTSVPGAPASADPILVIPNGEKLKVTIEYDVLTADENLAGKLNDGQTRGSVVKNVITRYITTDTAGNVADGDVTMVNGKLYTIALHLGLNTVDFNATVNPWDTGETGGADLPHNN